MGIIRTLLILALIYYGIKFLMKLFFPMIMKKFVNKVQKDMRKRQDPLYRESDFKDEKKGVFIKKSTDKATKSTKDFDGGEYIDFEDVDKTE